MNPVTYMYRRVQPAGPERWQLAYTEKSPAEIALGAFTYVSEPARADTIIEIHEVCEDVDHLWLDECGEYAYVPPVEGAARRVS